MLLGTIIYTLIALGVFFGEGTYYHSRNEEKILLSILCAIGWIIFVPSMLVFSLEKYMEDKR